MAQIIQLDFNKTNSASGVIDIATVQQSCRHLHRRHRRNYEKRHDRPRGRAPLCRQNLR